MAINKDNVLDASWNNESLLQIRTALQELLHALGDSIDAAVDGNPASINLSVEGTVLTAAVTLADGETELSSSVDLAGAISAAQVAVEIINNLYTNNSSKALSAAMGVQLDRMSGTVLKHLHWVPGAAHTSLGVGDHARYFEPEQGKIYHFYGYTPPGQGQPELGLDVYTPPAGIIFYDIETGSCYRFDGMDMVDILSSKANDNAVVKSISVNGQPQTKDTQGNVNILSVDGADGVTPHIGSNGNWFIGTTDTNVKARGVDGIDVSDPADIEVVHNLDDEKSDNFDPTSQVAVMGSDMGKVLKTAISTLIDSMGEYCFPLGRPTLSWEGAKADVLITLGSHTTSSNTSMRVDYGSGYETTLGTDDELYLIDDSNVVVKMGNVDITSTAYNGTTHKVTIAEVTGTIEITANVISYVSGLAFQLDCKKGITIENGIPTKWTDLAGGIEFTLTDVAAGNNGGLVFNGSSSKGVANGSLNVGYENATIEVVMDISSVTPASDLRLPILSNTPDGSAAAAFRIAGNSESRIIGCSTNGTGVSSPINTGFFFGLDNVAFGTTKDTVVIDGDEISSPRTKSSQYGANISVKDYTAGKSTVLAVGYSEIYNSTTGSVDLFYFSGTILAIRVYNSKLTAQQLGSNYLIDKKRFNLQ